MSKTAAPHGTFTCAACKGTFPKAWSDEEARAEFEQRFPGEPFDETVEMICDDCDPAVMAAWIKAGCP
jgi:hypothetical protein